jgi:hypothetical protein
VELEGEVEEVEAVAVEGNKVKILNKLENDLRQS